MRLWRGCLRLLDLQEKMSNLHRQLVPAFLLVRFQGDSMNMVRVLGQCSSLYGVKQRERRRDDALEVRKNCSRSFRIAGSLGRSAQAQTGPTRDVEDSARSVAPSR